MKALRHCVLMMALHIKVKAGCNEEENITMSRDFRPTRLITAANLFGGRLERRGVREVQPERPETGFRWLSDGENCMCVEISERGFVASITRYGENDPNNILHAIAQEFETDIIDEEHPEYWEGYEGEVVALDMSVIKGGGLN